MPDLNLNQLINTARLLRPLLDELVNVGGTVTGLLITDLGGRICDASRCVDPER